LYWYFLDFDRSITDNEMEVEMEETEVEMEK
jgi:hypothetical protein